jgi:hypothetical protein
MALKDLFELALTALAFKSFGLFMLNVIMCICGGVRNLWCHLFTVKIYVCTGCARKPNDF